MSKIEGENREHFETETNDAPELSAGTVILPKDIITISMSSLALLLSAIGVWFNFFRETSHLKMVVSDAFGHLEEAVTPFSGYDSQLFNATYDIVFFNDGNKNIVVTSVFHELMKVDAQKRDPDYQRGIFDTTTLDAQKTPVCKKNADATGLQKYQSDGQQKSQSAFVVEAGQFYIMTRATFYPLPIFTNIVAEGTTSTIASCFHISFVKPDGSAGSNSVPAATFTLAKQPIKGGEKPRLILDKGGPIEKIQSVDQ